VTAAQAQPPSGVAILQAAEACFEQFGIAKTTMDDVARRAQVSRATVYRHFSDREALILASVRRRARMNMEPAREFIARLPTFEERLVEGIVQNVRRGRKDPVLNLLLSVDDMALTTRLLGASGVAVELTHELWEPILQAAHESGDLRPSVDIVVLCEWISHLEMMFITQFADDDAAVERFRQMLRQFLAPAVVAR
jgi:AcrR family transcriptional regulator